MNCSETDSFLSTEIHRSYTYRFLLWSGMKGTVYKNILHTLDELKKAYQICKWVFFGASVYIFKYVISNNNVAQFHLGQQLSANYSLSIFIIVCF